MKKGIIRKDVYLGSTKDIIITEVRFVGILVYKWTVTLDCIKTVGLKPL
jgi:hypothetical protein